MDPLETMMAPTASRPMLGMTMLVVEDSLFASEALRLLCLRSGARIRRADCLKSARRHLRVYRPTAIIIDLRLPDGSGVELIEQLARAVPKVGVIVGMSGDTGMEEAALAAGADCFLAKPLTNLGQFQATILAHMPQEYRLTGPRALTSEDIEPDQVAYRDDMAHAAEILRGAPDDQVLGYLTQFLRGAAKCAGDRPMQRAVERLDAARDGGGTGSEMSVLAGLLQERIGQRMAI